MSISKEEIKKFYDDAAIRKLHGFIYGNTRIEYAWQTLNNLISRFQFKNILEIGSGIGEICHRVKSQLPGSKVVGFDISDESIEISEKLFSDPSLSFKRADSISELKLDVSLKFDLIYLMDVFEHIPLNERKPLSDFIKNKISENGYVFFSCPTPQHLSYLKKNVPAEIQPVDEDITLQVLAEFSKACNLRLVYYKEISVWRAGDYLHVIFSNQLNMQPFSDYRPYQMETIGLKGELLKRFGLSYQKRIAKEKDLEIKKRKQFLKTKIGDETLKKIENFK